MFSLWIAAFRIFAMRPASLAFAGVLLSAAMVPALAEENAAAAASRALIGITTATSNATSTTNPTSTPTSTANPTSTPTAAALAKSGAIPPAERSADLQAHWALRRDYLRDRDERRAEDEEQRVRQLKEDLALDNLFAIGAALVRESHDALASGAPAVARKLCSLAVELAPALAAAHGCLARAILAENPTALKAALAELVAAARAGLLDPRESRAALANACGVALAGLLAAGLAFALLLFLRYAQLYLHDVHHLFPAGARRWQTRLLAAVLLLSPLLLQAGLLPLLFTLLLACALYASTVEAVIAFAVLALFAAAPGAGEGLARLATFGGPAADIYAVERGEGTGAELPRLRARLARAETEMAVAFTLAHKAKREGDLQSAEQLYRKALDSSQGASSVALAAAHNNLGNVYLLVGELQKAMAQYGQAIELQETFAAPHFNLSRALNIFGVEALEKLQTEQARALELDRAAIDRFTGGQLSVNRKMNKLVLDLTLPDSTLIPLLETEARMAAPVAGEVRALLGCPADPTLALAAPLLAAALFFGLHLLRGRLRPSGRCERCGREVCKRCDADARPSEALCAQCVNVFVRRTGVDPTERIRKEGAVQAYQRRRTALARLSGVVSGAGHVLLGYPVSGAVFLFLTAVLGASLVLWRGIARDPVVVRSGVSLFRIGATVASFVALYALCLRDLVAKQRAEGS